MGEHLRNIDPNSEVPPDNRLLLHAVLSRAMLAYGAFHPFKGEREGLALLGPTSYESRTGWKISTKPTVEETRYLVADSLNGGTKRRVRTLLELGRGVFELTVNYSRPLSFVVGHQSDLYNTGPVICHLAANNIGRHALPKDLPFVFIDQRIRDTGANGLLDDPFQSHTIREIFNDLNLRMLQS